jgi:hypothetical protein
MCESLPGSPASPPDWALRQGVGSPLQPCFFPILQQPCHVFLANIKKYQERAFPVFMGLS